jgi:hypothetical protein
VAAFVALMPTSNRSCNFGHSPTGYISGQVDRVQHILGSENTWFRAVTWARREKQKEYINKDSDVMQVSVQFIIGADCVMNKTN